MSTKDALILALTARDQGVQEELSRLREYAKQHAPVVIEGFDRQYPTHPVFGICTHMGPSFLGFQLRVNGDLLLEEYCPHPHVAHKSYWETISSIHILHTSEGVRFVIYALEGEQSHVFLTINISSTRVECRQRKAGPPLLDGELYQVFGNPCISELNLAARLQAWLESVELDCKIIHKHIN